MFSDFLSTLHAQVFPNENEELSDHGTEEQPIERRAEGDSKMETSGASAPWSATRNHIAVSHEKTLGTSLDDEEVGAATDSSFSEQDPTFRAPMLKHDSSTRVPKRSYSSTFTRIARDKRFRKKLVEYFKMDEHRHFLGVVCVLINTLVAVRFPEHYWIVYFAHALVLIPWRYFRFKQRREELFLLDFCYFVTYYTCIGCILALLRVNLLGDSGTDSFATLNEHAVKAGFTFANGVLIWSIALFRNALVFHSVDHMTSVFIHLAPAVLFYCIRWGSGFGPSRVHDAWNGMFHVCPPDKYGDSDRCISNQFWCEACPASLLDLVVYPMAAYLVLWAIPFFVTMFCILPGYVRRNDKNTLYAEVLEDEFMGKMVRTFPKAVQPLAYMLNHFVTTAFFGLLSIVFWKSFWLHTALVGGLCLVAIRNGATWFFRIFALRYAGNTIHAHRMSLDATRESHYSSSALIEMTESVGASQSQ